MTFKEFFQKTEAVKTTDGPLDIIKQHIKSAQPVKNKGTSVGRFMTSFTSTASIRPVKVTTVNGPLTKPSVLK